MSQILKGTILITGGAGYLGRGLIARAEAEQWDARFIVYSRDPQKHVLLANKYSSDLVRTVIGDVLDTERLSLAMIGADYVVHAAALKHLPECEAQPSQAIHVNVDGTRSVMQAALNCNVARMVCISTDKAADPSNTYGMTKALVERLVFETREFGTQTIFTATRYGNVVGSTGSVWHRFKEQAAVNDRLSVTDPQMTRFFVSIEDAIDVVLEAFMAPAGTVVLPKAGSLNLGKLSDFLTKHWNLKKPDIIGCRPGEKSHESMISVNEVSRIIAGRDDSGYYLLNGPTIKVPESAVVWYPTPTSELAVPMPPEFFLELAEASADV